MPTLDLSLKHWRIMRKKLVFITALIAGLLISTTTAQAGQHPALSPAARDLQGIEQSLYQGKHYQPHAYEKFRLCVIQRESRGSYRAANTSSSARGAYQFLDRSWRGSLVWMLLPEHKSLGLTDEVKALRNLPIHHWNRYWQDAAFWTVITARSDNWRHWQGGSCDSLMR